MSSELRQRQAPTAASNGSSTNSENKTETKIPENKVSLHLFKFMFLILEVFFIFLMTHGQVFGLLKVFLKFPIFHLVALAPDMEDIPFAVLGVAFNVVTFVAWGAAHSLSAQPWFQTMVEDRCMLDKAHVFVVGSGVAAILAMMLWQPYEDEENVIWDINPLPWNLTLYENDGVGSRIYFTTYAVFDIVIHFIALGQIGKLLTRLSGASKSERKSGAVPSFEKKQVVSDGWYGVVRHPVYTVMMLMLVVTLRMNLGRICVILSFIAYLVPGVYFEEKRLEEEFGKETYQAYRVKVPSQFIPFIY